MNIVHFRALPGVLAMLVLAWGSVSLSAAKIDPAKVTGVEVGPITPYGETPAEIANKRVMFEYLYLKNIKRQPQAAFEKYVSSDYCNHSHVSTMGRRECSGYDETLAKAIATAKAYKPGDLIEEPTMASVNGDMVTMYSEGVDVFRVHDGKITDHWDATPPDEVLLRKLHTPEFTQWVMGGEIGPRPK